MDPINRLNSIMAALQRQIAETGRHTGPSHKAATGNNPAVHATAPGLQELRRKLQQRLRGVNPDDTQKDRKSQRLFLESVLAWEFGEGLLQDSRFDELIDNIQLALNSNPTVESQMRELLKNLTADTQE
jgi:hypothetical protein